MQTLSCKQAFFITIELNYWFILAETKYEVFVMCEHQLTLKVLLHAHMQNNNMLRVLRFLCWQFCWACSLQPQEEGSQKSLLWWRGSQKEGLILQHGWDMPYNFSGTSSHTLCQPPQCQAALIAPPTPSPPPECSFSLYRRANLFIFKPHLNTI